MESAEGGVSAAAAGGADELAGAAGWDVWPAGAWGLELPAAWLRTATAPLLLARVLALWVSQTRPKMATNTIKRIQKICFMPSP
jgi:hypothetical protein